VAAIPVPLRFELGITVPDKDVAGAVADSKKAINQNQRRKTK